VCLYRASPHPCMTRTAPDMMLACLLSLVVEHSLCKRKVGGSIPPVGFLFFQTKGATAGRTGSQERPAPAKKKRCANRESNPALKLGKLQCYRYTIGADCTIQRAKQKYSRGGLNSRPSACKADVITTRLLELSPNAVPAVRPFVITVVPCSDFCLPWDRRGGARRGAEEEEKKNKEQKPTQQEAPHAGIEPAANRLKVERSA
jgi:hypothetical protein